MSIALHDALIENLLARYGEKGVNAQRILDNPLFQSLPLPEKIRLIQKYQGDLSRDPRFHWGSVKGGVKTTAAIGALGTGMSQLMNFNKGVPLRSKLVGVGVGAVTGALVGGLTGLIGERLSYLKDLRTQGVVADPVAALMSRYGNGEIVRPSVPSQSIVLYGINKLQNAPVDIGNNMAAIVHTLPRPNSPDTPEPDTSV